MANPTYSNAHFSVERLRAILSYNPETGIFIWKVREDRLLHWNSRYANKQAGSVSTRNGKPTHITIQIDDVAYTAHQLAWYYMIGVWPNSEIDHKNKDPLDNRFTNLRLASPTENGWNKSKYVNNTSGYKGAYWDKKHNVWVAKIRVNKKLIHIGSFKSAEEAHAAYCSAAIKHAGEFARFS